MNRSLLLSLGSVVLLSACADLATMKKAGEPRAGFDTVANASSRATGANAVWLQSPAEIKANAQRVHSLTHGKTISANNAVQVALLNNRGLQARYAELGLSATDLWEIARGPVPTVGLSASGLAGGDVARSVEATLIASILDIATQKPRTENAKLAFRQAQLAAAGETVSLAHETRRAWIEAVAAFEAAALIKEAQSAADAASELASELGATGAYSKADQAREYAFTAELAAEQAEATLEAQLAKERLVRLMGLWGSGTTIYVPDALPMLPGSQPNPANLEKQALTNRVDLAIGRLELQAIANEYRLQGQTRILSGAEIVAGVTSERDGGQNDTSRVTRFEFQVPAYDSGGLIARRGRLTYARSANELAQAAIDARSEARSAYSAVTGKYQIARHWRDQVLPLRRQINEQSLLSYSGMLTSAFELLTDARNGLESELRAAESKRDYWLAEADMAATIWGGPDAEGEDG